MRIREIYMYILGGIVVLCLFVLVYILLYVEIPQQNKDILNILTGGVLSAFLLIVNFFFGSSMGSKDKTDILMTK